MKYLTMIILALFVSYQSIYGDAKAEFETRTTQLSSLIKKLYPDSNITCTEKSFEAEFDTMIYTVHGGGSGSKGPNGGVNYSIKTFQRKGPRAYGFIIEISLLPNPTMSSPALFNRGIRQTPYWEEYYWWGCRDTKQHIRLDIKFGHRVSEKSKAEIIKIVSQIPAEQFDPLKNLPKTEN